MLLWFLSPLSGLVMFRLLTPSLIALALLAPYCANAAEWSVKGFVDQNLSYDDNVLMRQDAQGSFKYMIVPTVTFQHRTDRSEISANASYGTQLYTDIEGFDQDIQHYGLKSMFRSEKFDWGLNANYSVTPTRNNAVQNSGVFNNNSNSNTWSVLPFLTYKIDDNNSLSLTPTYSETTYSSSNSSSTAPGVSNNFRNYNSFNVSLAWQHLWSERYLSAVSLFYNKYDSQPSTNSSLASTTFDSEGINISNTYLLSETWKLSGTLGGRYTESTTGTVNSNSLGFLADAGADYTGEQLSSGIHFNRSLMPSSLGQLQEQTSVDFNIGYKILEKLTAKFTTSYQESTFVNTANPTTRKNLLFQPSVNWQFAPEWTLGGSYRYRLQDGLINNNGTSVSNAEADSNLFMISVNYNWQGLSLSR